MLALPAGADLRRRLVQLFPGLGLCGVGLALMVLARLGLGPWDVLHQGLSERTGLPIGTLVILVGFVVLLGWFPLRQRLGGTGDSTGETRHGHAGSVRRAAETGR